ncbi:MAG: beta-galactosidase, partial [Microbacteriaceae bacterium]
MVARTRPVDGLAFGGDVNPEQWDAAVLDDDIRLMGEAGVNLVTLGVFSWATIEPREGEYDFALFDRAIAAYHAAGIAVDLATPTAAPPIWLHQKHPEILPVTRTGQRYAQGGRLGWCASSPVWRRYAEGIVTALAERYGSHPAVRLWHLGNELGGGNRHCYCDESARAFRDWLRERHGDIDTLNAAWGTAFWGHRYTDFEQVLPPRDSETIGRGNPGLVLDFDRFSSDALLEHYLAEKAIVLRHSGETPITTNFMVGEGSHVVDYARWAREVDIVANDHYLLAADPERAHSVAFAADRTRGLSPETPWMLMETAASAVSWQPINRPPEPGELRRTAFTHLGRGADGVLFFQWRQSLAGAEQFHSAMVPHAGADSPTFVEVTQLGRELALAAELAGAPVAPAQVAVLADDESGWAWKSGPKPLADHALGAEAARWHRALWRRGIRCDILPPAGDLTAYDVVVVPSLFLVDPSTAEALAAAVARGATVIVTRLSGIVDENNAVVPGGYPGRLAE